jgi:Tol biopolymer transport system component
LLPDVRGTQEAPAWSSDGTRLLFAARDNSVADSQELIWETNAGGVGPRLISTECLPPACLNEYAPAYSPDGRVIAFIRFVGPLGGPPTTSVVALRDMARGSVMELESTRTTFSDGFVDRPRWSPDGTALVYSKVLTDPTKSGCGAQPSTSCWAVDSIVMVVDRDGGNPRVLTEPGFEAGDADWSPDGSRIAFAREPIHHWSGAGKGAGANQWIYTIAPDGTGLTQLTSERSGGPSWTSGGSQILFTLIATQTTPSGDHAAPGVAVMSPDGSNQTPVARFSDCCRWYPVQQPMP